jgi:hypothetical protein
MSRRKIPPDAFYLYMSLGPKGSYEAVAEKYGVSKRAVTALAAKERWQERLQEIQKKAADATKEKVIESLEAMNERHLKALRAIQAKALDALRSVPLNTALAAVRALDLSIRQERTIRGEPSDRTAVSVEDVIRREYERWMVTPEKNTEAPEETEGDVADIPIADEPQ